MDALDAFRLVDLLGVAAGAASGALAARRREGFDLVGVLGLAFACVLRAVRILDAPAVGFFALASALHGPAPRSSRRDDP